MKVAIGADHAGFTLKEKLKECLSRECYELVDVGAAEYEPGDDYPAFAAAAAEKVASGEADRGIVICDTGIGVDIVANKFAGVRSALVHNEALAERTRQHNDSNVLALGSMVVDEDTAARIARRWLETEFSRAERHERRIREIERLEREEVAHA